MLWPPDGEISKSGTTGLPAPCYLKQAMKEPEDQFIRYRSTGRPLGSAEFIEREKILQRDLQKKKQGLKVYWGN